MIGMLAEYGDGQVTGLGGILILVMFMVDVSLEVEKDFSRII